MVLKALVNPELFRFLSKAKPHVLALTNMWQPFFNKGLLNYIVSRNASTKWEFNFERESRLH